MNGVGLIPRPLAYALIGLISLLWGADVLTSILDETHKLNTTLGTAFLVVAGLLGGLSKGRPGSGPAEPDPPEPPPTRPDPLVAPDEQASAAPGAVSARELLDRYRGEYPPTQGRRR